MKQGMNMDVTQFQQEADTVCDCMPPTPVRVVLPIERIAAAVESLLLGLNLRGWLTAVEYELLESLGTNDCRLFLIDEREYLYPRGFELFPLDLIRTARPEGEDAVFRHRYCPSGDPHCGGYVIHSAYVNCPDSQPLILGMYGAQASASTEDEAYFGELVAVFREASEKAQRIKVQLGSRIEPLVPFLVVNRCSGRVIDANKSALKALRLAEDELVGAEYSAIKHVLAPVIATHRVTIRNLTAEECRLAIITCTPVISREPEPDYSEQCLNKMRDKISNVMAASSFLAALVDTTDESDLAHTITDEMTELDALLDRFHLILNYENLAKVKVELAEELRHALRRISRYGLFDGDVELISDIPQTSISAPPTAIAVLIESILRDHNEAAMSGETTRIEAIGNEAEQGTALRFTTRCEDAHKFDRDIRGAAFAKKLASMMQIGLSETVSETDQTLSTTIEIPA